MHDFKKQILSDFKDLYSGPAWHGPNMVQTLQRFIDSSPENRCKDSHSAVEILAHITAWRRFTIEKLNGNREYKMTDEMNFPKVNLANWEEERANLEVVHFDLIEAITRFPDREWETLVPGKDYSYAKLLSGLLQHDTYHLGQLILLSK
jgi:uncharacterized damage-inducible protein DinB